MTTALAFSNCFARFPQLVACAGIQATQRTIDAREFDMVTNLTQAGHGR
jgi:hypothetical protein